MSTFFDFLLLLIGFSLVIFVHELGHFAVAKWVGIKVEQFAIGMGPALLSWRKGIGFRPGTTQPEYEARLKSGSRASDLGETEYRLNYLPIGGYVKMLGQEDLDMAAVVSDPRSYSSRPIWARMCVVSAGVVMNIIFALVLFVICFMWGVQTVMPVIGGISPDSLAAVTLPTKAAEQGITAPGIRPGDRIISINGKPIRSYDQILLAAAVAKPGRTLSIEVDRQGTRLTFDLAPRADRETRLLALGINSTQSASMMDYAPGSAFEKRVQSILHLAGLEGIEPAPGLTLTHVDGEEISAIWQLSRAIDESDGRSLRLTFQDPATGAVQEGMLRPDPDFMLAQVQHESGWYAVRHLLGLVPAPVIREVDSRKKDWLAGGDVIVGAGKARWPRPDELYFALSPRAKAAVTVQRDGQTHEFNVVVNRSGEAGFAWNDMPAMAPPIVADTLPTIALRSAGGADAKETPSPAAAVNIMPGSRILTLNGQSVETWRDVFVALRRALEPARADLKTQVDRDASSSPLTPSSFQIELTCELPIPGRPVETLAWSIDPSTAQAVLDLEWHSLFSVSLFKPLMETQKASNPIAAVQMGIERTWEMIVVTYQTLDRLVRGTIKVDQLKGPVGIAELGTRVAGQGIPYLLLFLGVINVNLAVLNFLPIPIVDGGLMVFLIVEKIKGSPVSIQVQNAATVVGLLLIGSLFLVTFYNDVLNLITNLTS